jgi:hypothetical protein
MAIPQRTATTGTFFLTTNRRRLFQINRNAELFLETSQIMNLIKGGFSHRLASKLPVWQRGFTDHHSTARLVETPEAYPHTMNPPIRRFHQLKIFISKVGHKTEATL